MRAVWLFLLLVEEGFSVAPKVKDAAVQSRAVRPSQKPQPSRHCGTWIRNPEGGTFCSPNYPKTYPPNKECLYVLEALPRQRVELVFSSSFFIEASFQCRFDHLEVRDGPFSFSPPLQRLCGSAPPPRVLSSGRFMWIRFYSDEELEGTGFQVHYSFTADPEFHLHVGGLLNPIPDCQFELSGPDGLIRSSQVEEDYQVKPDQAVDCIWTIRAPPKNRIYLRFLEYQMENSNECKKNFVAVYDGSSAIEDLKAKFCSTVANDIMLETGVGVVRMWADESSRLSRFRMLFTSFADPPCLGDAFFCHSNMCINTTLVCNGVQNCVFPWDESNCKEKKSKSVFLHINKTHGTVICVSTGVVLLLLVFSILVQVKQPRKKVLVRKNNLFQRDYPEDPPHYELFTLRDKEVSGDLGELSEELQSLQALRRSSSGSRCVHEHHCGSQASLSSLQGAGGPLGLLRGPLELLRAPLEPSPFRGPFQSSLPPLRDFNSSLRKKSWPSLQQGRSQGPYGPGGHALGPYSPGARGPGTRSLGRQDRVMEEEEEEEEQRYDAYVRRAGSRRGFEMNQQRSLSMDF